MNNISYPGNFIEGQTTYTSKAQREIELSVANIRRTDKHGRNVDWVVEQFLQVECCTQIAPCVGDKEEALRWDHKRRSAEYLPEPVAMLEVRGECGGEGRPQGCGGGLYEGLSGF
ncbi:hypothetical protein VNO78_23105 [Psophocarpus tetragonolobus]|uniref:Uncharacterized protein n=1 Tax=Psophocarpus tetragonolobus TaxID=3891 RepID=A0AAN9XDP0_PSOTE